jgi:hypothetical protein
MAKKVSELTAVSSLTGTEIIPVVQSGTSKKATIDNVIALATGSNRNNVTALSIASGVVDIDYSDGDYHTLALTANVTSLTFSNLPGSGKGASLIVLLTQDSTARTFAFPASFKWEGGSVPSISTGSGVKDLLAISTLDNGTTWHATLSKARS